MLMTGYGISINGAFSLYGREIGELNKHLTEAKGEKHYASKIMDETKLGWHGNFPKGRFIGVKCGL